MKEIIFEEANDRCLCYSLLIFILGSLSNDVFERRTSTGSCPFSFLGDGFAQIFSQIVSIRVKKLSNTNYIASRHITREKSSLPVDVRCSKTSLLKLPIIYSLTSEISSIYFVI